MGRTRNNKFTKAEKSWILYDWANSVYATNMMAAIFPIYYAGVAGDAGDKWWGIGVSAASLIVAVMAPFLGAFGDFRGMKKKLLILFLALGVGFTAVTAFTGSWQLMLVGYVISHIGFSGANVFYDSFLTDVTTNERMDRVSSWGYAMGYIGGSTIPFVISIAVLLIMGMDNPAAVKFSVVITSVWWLIFSIPILKNVNQTHYIEAPASKLLSHTFQSLKKTLREIFRNKTIFIFIIAYFFYIDGVGTVIHMATSYGTNLGLDTTGMIIALLVTQIVAMPCSILFGRASGKFSSIKLILFAIAMYLVICVLGFYMGFHVEQAELSKAADPQGYQSALAFSQTLFWIMAVLVGTVQGGVQAISRSYFGKLVPPEKSNEFFGFFDIFGKFATVMGPAIVALISGLTGRDSIGVLSVSVLFLIGGGLLIGFRSHFTAEAAERSKQAAKNDAG